LGGPGKNWEGVIPEKKRGKSEADWGNSAIGPKKSFYMKCKKKGRGRHMQLAAAVACKKKKGKGRLIKEFQPTHLCVFALEIEEN